MTASFGTGGITAPGISYTAYNPTGIGSTFEVRDTIKAETLVLSDGTETVTLDIATLKALIQQLGNQ